MEENNILNKNNKKKILIGSIIIVLVLILVVITSTYAYFNLNVNGDGTSTKVTITTGSNNQIKLSGGLEDFHIRLEVKDMAYNRRDREYYATNNKELNYETDKDKALKEIGKVEVIGELEERQVCTAKAKVNLDGDMASLIEEGDLEISLVNGMYTNTSDLTKIIDNTLATLEFVITDKNTHSIQAYLKFRNRDYDQSYLINKKLNVEIIIEDFECNTDTEIPVVDKFYFDNNESKEQQYTNSINHTLHLSWEDRDVTEYCITTNNSYEECVWTKTNGQQSVQESITLDGKEGDHKYYGYIKDKIGNISLGVTASIIYDNTIPTINSFYIKEEGTSKYTNQQKNTVYYQYTDTNIKDICITEEQTTEGCDWKTISSSKNIDYTFKTNTEELKTIYGYVRDKANNISANPMIDTITYDKTAPSISSIENINIGETSVTLKVNGSDTLSGIDKYCYSTSNSTTDVGICGTSADGNITINNLKDGQSYTYYFYLIDKAGNSGITSKTQRKFETESAGTGKKLINDRTNIPNLQNTAVNGLYRYYGNYDVVTNNYICLGPSGNTCKSDADKNNYLYRIIGIADGTEKSTLDIDLGSIKVIKAMPIGKQSWNSTNDNTDWDSSSLQIYLNGTFYNDSTLLVQRIKDKIQSVKWYKGDVKYSCSYSRECPPEKESTTLTKNFYSIGLMYASDYYNSWTYGVNTNSWLFISHGCSSIKVDLDFEKTMTKFGLGDGNKYYAWIVDFIGCMYGGEPDSVVDYAMPVRPVFYLQSNVKLTGEGTEGNPYILN